MSGDVTKWSDQLKLLGQHVSVIRTGKLNPAIKSEPPIVRESIISPGSFNAPEHFLGTFDHEAKMLEDFDARRKANVGSDAEEN